MAQAVVGKICAITLLTVNSQNDIMSYSNFIGEFMSFVPHEVCRPQHKADFSTIIYGFDHTGFTPTGKRVEQPTSQNEPIAQHTDDQTEDNSTEYLLIKGIIDQKWPIAEKNQRVFARTMKLVEELGELADELLSSMNLQRQDKQDAFHDQKVEDEFADVLASVVLLAAELDIDIAEVMKRKIEYTKKRFESV